MSEEREYLVQLYQCDECLEWFGADGPEGIVPHVLREHPFSALAETVDAMLLERILSDGDDRGTA